MMLRQLLQGAVARAVAAAEPPVCVVLSGGIDSSTVACLAPGVPALTGWYDHPGCDEVPYALVASGGRQHELVEITPDDFASQVDVIRERVNAASVGPGIVGQWMVAARAAELGYRTILSGEGGDELFGGYARLLRVAGLPLPDGYPQDYRPLNGYPSDLVGALRYDWEHLPLLLTADDQVAAAHGLRVVSPLLDNEVVEWTLARPASERVGKVLLRDAMRGVVPDVILDRTDKKGFPVPFVSWMQHEPLRSWIRDRIGYVPDPREPYSRGWWHDLMGQPVAR